MNVRTMMGNRRSRAEVRARGRWRTAAVTVLVVGVSTSAAACGSSSKSAGGSTTTSTAAAQAATTTAPRPEVTLSGGVHQAAFRLPVGWSVTKKNGANTVNVSDGKTQMFITVGQSSSSSATTDLQSDLHNLGLPSTTKFSSTSTLPVHNSLFTEEALVTFQSANLVDAYGAAFEYVDSNASDDFSAFLDAQSPTQAAANSANADIAAIVGSLAANGS